MKAKLDEDSRAVSCSAFFAAFSILFALWLAFSEHWDVFHLSLGLLCSALVSYMSHDLMFHHFHWHLNPYASARFLLYLPWLFYQIVLANLHVARMVLHPRMPITPRIFDFPTRLRKEIALATLGNSITLTPGTITIDIFEGKFCVHALTQKVADDLLGGEMESRVAAIFDESTD